MEIPLFTVDSFARSPFEGNPAAICLLENPLQEELYQKIAAEMNLSETAFITKLKATDDFCSGARFSLRWFTPIHEIALCGHATLASSAVLFYKKENVNPVVVFETLSGELRVGQRGEFVVMDFPLNKPEAQDHSLYKDLLKAAVGDLPVQDVCLCKTTKNLLVRLADSCGRSALTSIKPEAESLLRHENGSKIKGMIVTIKGESTSQVKYDFFSRYFSPWHGVLEDPVCGSAHTVLAAYWSEQLGKKKLLAYQCSRRGGELELELRDDGRVNIVGRAVVLLQGTLKL
ncbi:phenazine biosynthesis-like domain-containing protein 1 [Colossoma macropomum]|uniref:phenazine biosynthesis-like domain-containing protein 1 n=1 Tax=Colossoma macropomum TaxID=42526 RepID=UPI0018648983|nr:phenazine biosynthesis-like domain-containing protein 1 [Colossoma macropomum]